MAPRLRDFLTLPNPCRCGSRGTVSGDGRDLYGLDTAVQAFADLAHSGPTCDCWFSSPGDRPCTACAHAVI